MNNFTSSKNAVKLFLVKHIRDKLFLTADDSVSALKRSEEKSNTLKIRNITLTFTHIQQICSRRALNSSLQNTWKVSINVSIITRNMVRRFWHGENMVKRFWQKEKLLILNNLSSCHYAIKSRLLHMCQKASIYGKGLKQSENMRGQFRKWLLIFKSCIPQWGLQSSV